METKPNHLVNAIEERTNGDMPDGNYFHYGLTKREYFAAMAMQGVCSTNQALLAKEVAVWSVKMADELIKALNTK